MKLNKTLLLIPLIMLVFGCGGGGGGGSTPPGPSLVSINVTATSLVIAPGATEQFTATGTYSDNTTKDLTTSVGWSSSKTAVATINSSGMATAGATTGASTIKAQLGGVSATSTLSVLSATSSAANVAPVTVNGALCSEGSYPNKPCVSVTICAPGTTNCQTINDILLDTGSYGLRIFKQVLTVPLQQETVSSGNLAECIQYVDNSVDWGPVKSANVILAGESTVTVPIQVIDSTFGGGAPPYNINTGHGCLKTTDTLDTSPSTAGFNGILGVGLFVEDCGPGCVSVAGNNVYFACTGTTCSGSTAPLASQVQNPVAKLPVDNNGVLVQLPAVPSGGIPSDSG